MVAVPTLTPVTLPDPFTVAWALELLHVPLILLSLSELVVPTQTTRFPQIAAVAGLMVNTKVREQPDGTVYVTVAVPVDKP